MVSDDKECAEELARMTRLVQEGARDLILCMQGKGIPAHHAFVMLTCASIVLGMEVSQPHIGCELAKEAALGMRVIVYDKPVGPPS